MLRSLEHAYGITLLLGFPAAGLLIRLFIIHHDCGRGSFFRSRAANDTLGFVLGVLSLTPYGYWRSTHLTLRQSLKSIGLKLWDEDLGKLIGFRHLHKLKSRSVSVTLPS